MRVCTIIVCYAFPGFRAKVQPPVQSQVILAKRYGGVDAQAAGIVDEVCPLAELRDTAIAAAGKLAGREGLDRRTLVTLKRDLYRDAYCSLSAGVTYTPSKL